MLGRGSVGGEDVIPATGWTCEVHELSEGFSAIVYDEHGQMLADHLDEDRALLIAAAPDGLAVASDICAILDGQCAHDGEALVYDDYHTIGEEVARLHEKLTAYIAKARGEVA